MELAAGLDPELLDEKAARLLVGGKPLRLPAAAVQGDHKLGAQPLTQRLLRNERLELTDERHVVAKRKVGLDPLLERLQAEPVDACDLGLGEALVGEVGKRPPTEKSERLAQQCGGLDRLACPRLSEQALKPVQIEAVGCEYERVATGTPARFASTRRLMPSTQGVCAQQN